MEQQHASLDMNDSYESNGFFASTERICKKRHNTSPFHLTVLFAQPIKLDGLLYLLRRIKSSKDSQLLALWSFIGAFLQFLHLYCFSCVWHI